MSCVFFCRMMAVHYDVLVLLFLCCLSIHQCESVPREWLRQQALKEAARDTSSNSNTNLLAKYLSTLALDNKLSDYEGRSSAEKRGAHLGSMEVDSPYNAKARVCRPICNHCTNHLSRRISALCMVDCGNMASEAWVRCFAAWTRRDRLD